MANEPAAAVNMDAIITDGPMAGLTVGQALDYATALKAATEAGTAAPARPTPAAAPPAPGAVLERHAGDRVDQVTMATWLRLEQDDEAQFAAGVPDYDTYREKIAEAKKQMPPEMRISRGLHKRLYENFRLDDPAMQAHIYGRPAPAPAPAPAPTEEVVDDGTAPPPPPAPTPTPAARPPAPPQPRAVPPAAAPTPSARSTPAPAGNTRVPKLRASAKIESAAAAYGLTVNDYLIALEDRGVTQEAIDLGSVAASTSSTSPRSNAYERKRAGR